MSREASDLAFLSTYHMIDTIPTAKVLFTDGTFPFRSEKNFSQIVFKQMLLNTPTVRAGWRLEKMRLWKKLHHQLMPSKTSFSVYEQLQNFWPNLHQFFFGDVWPKKGDCLNLLLCIKVVFSVEYERNWNEKLCGNDRKGSKDWPGLWVKRREQY